MISLQEQADGMALMITSDCVIPTLWLNEVYCIKTGSCKVIGL
jgi:hypothetical protein